MHLDSQSCDWSENRETLHALSIHAVPQCVAECPRSSSSVRRNPRTRKPPKMTYGLKKGLYVYVRQNTIRHVPILLPTRVYETSATAVRDQEHLCDTCRSSIRELTLYQKKNTLT